jgi:hypothetical protein
MKTCSTAQYCLRSSLISKDTMMEQSLSFRCGAKKDIRYMKSSCNVSNAILNINFHIAEITTWNVFFKHFIYKTEAPDENSGYYHLVDLENENSTYLIKDFVNDPSCMNIYTF